MLAKSVGGSVERFVEMMNEKARDIGMKQTHFSNPSGLDEEDEEIYQQLKKWRYFIVIVAKILFLIKLLKQKSIKD